MIKNPTYKFYTAGNMVAAVSSFAGKKVRGVAKCNPNDNFDLEKGKALAAARCGEKVARKRVKRAYAKIDEARAQLDVAVRNYEEALSYQNDAEIKYNDAVFELENVLSCI